MFSSLRRLGHYYCFFQERLVNDAVFLSAKMKGVFHCVLGKRWCLFHRLGGGFTASFFTVWTPDWSASCDPRFQRDLGNGKARPCIPSWQNPVDKRSSSYSFRMHIMGNVIDEKKRVGEGGEKKAFVWYDPTDLKSNYNATEIGIFFLFHCMEDIILSI